MSNKATQAQLASDALGPGESRLLRVDGRRLAVFRLEDGRLFAVDDACPHEGYPLSQGTVKDCVVTCPWHNFKFRLDDGSCLKGDEAVASHLVHEESGTIHIELVDPQSSNK